MVSQLSLSVFSGEVSFRLEVCVAGSSYGHEEPGDRCGLSGAALAVATAGVSEGRGLGTK